MITLSKNAQAILDELIQKVDTEQRIKRTFSEADMVELALILLSNMNKCKLDVQGEMLIGLSVAEFEISRSQS